MTLRLAVSTRGGRLDDHGFAGVDDGGVAAGKALHAPVVAARPVLADVTGLAPGQPERAHAAMPRQNRAVHFFQETNRAAHAVASVPFAAPARAFADVEVLEQHGITKFQHFGIGEARIGHVGVHGVGTGKSGTRRRARADRLVVLIFRVPEVEIVHGPLRGGERAERAEQAIRDRL